MTDDPCTSPARELARRIRDRELSATEALEAHLARIATRNPALNAVVSLDEERARALARTADATPPHGRPLHGVPMTLKDAHDVAGLRTTVGTPELDRIAVEDGAVAARLAAAGAVVRARPRGGGVRRLRASVVSVNMEDLLDGRAEEARQGDRQRQRRRVALLLDGVDGLT